jgi:hypothetical protein
MAKIGGYNRHAGMFLFLLFIGSLPLSSVYAQSNEELLEMIKRMREQIEAQQKQLQRMEQELRQKVKDQGPAEVQTALPAAPAASTAPASGRKIVNDWYLAGFVGGAFTLRSNAVFSTVPPLEPSTSLGEDVSLTASPVVGAKGGVCLNYFPNFCGELELEHFRPNIDEQQTRGVFFFPTGTIAGGFFPNMDLSVWNLGLSFLGQIGFVEGVEYPLAKRLHLYLGGGPSFVWTEARAGSSPFGGKKDVNFVLGFHALAGLKYFITEKFSVFGEYKFKHWEPGVFKLGSGRFDLSSFNANLFYIGLAFHP